MAHESGSAFDNFMETLSEESAQDAAALQDDVSFLLSANASNLVRREMEYNDPEKQFVRGEWLRYAGELNKRLGRQLSYLTLPAYYRIDVTMMLEKDFLAKRRENGRDVLKVAAFETDPTKFARMRVLSPEFRVFGNCRLEDAMTDPKNIYHDDLRRMFPFDMINFDLTTSLTPQHEGPYSRVMQALEEVMKRQASSYDEWVLFLTFRNSEAEWEQTALNVFIDNLQSNLDQWPSVRDKFVGKLQVNNAKALQKKDPSSAIIQSVAKWLVDRGHTYGIGCEKIDSYRYQRYSEGLDPYTISKLLMRFKRGPRTQAIIPTKATVRETWMETDLVRCIEQNKHKDIEALLLDRDGRLETIAAETERLIGVFNALFTNGNEAPAASG